MQIFVTPKKYFRANTILLNSEHCRIYNIYNGRVQPFWEMVEHPPVSYIGIRLLAFLMTVTQLVMEYAPSRIKRFAGSVLQSIIDKLPPYQVMWKNIFNLF